MNKCICNTTSYEPLGFYKGKEYECKIIHGVIQVINAKGWKLRTNNYIGGFILKEGDN
jgi:hypothetical protein